MSGWFRAGGIIVRPEIGLPPGYEPPSAALAAPKTPQQELHEALHDHLFRELRETPFPERRHARWVMNQEWLDEITDMVRAMPYQPPPVFGEPVTLLGKPVDVRADGGVPHLEATP